MSSGVVTVGRRPYAVGLYWENSPSGRVVQAAKEAARQPGHQADFYAIRAGNNNGRVPQFGLGMSSMGHENGMAVLAGCLANQHGGSWAGAFRLNEGSVIIIVRDDLIVPDGDQFFDNESIARDRLLQEMSFGGLQRIYAPEAWAIPGADSMPLSLLLHDRRDIRLSRMEVPKKLIMGMLLGAVGLAALVAGGVYYQQVMEEEDRKRAEADALAAMRAKEHKIVPDMLQAAPPPAYPPAERKWEAKPKAIDVINSCHTAITHILAAYNGWQLSQLKCDGIVLTMAYTRLNKMSRPLEFPSPARVVINDRVSNAIVTIPLDPLQPRGQEELPSLGEIVSRYLALNWHGIIAGLPDDPPPPPPAGYRGPWAPPLPPWLKRSFTVTVPDLPGAFLPMFNDMGGVVIDSLSYNPGGLGGEWVIGGIVYANRM